MAERAAPMALVEAVLAPVAVVMGAVAVVCKLVAVGKEQAVVVRAAVGVLVRE